MSRPRHIRDAQRDRESDRASRIAAVHARWDREDRVYRAEADDEIRRQRVEREAMTPAEREAADRRLFDKWSGALALALLIVGPVLADTAARSLHVL